MFRVADLLQAKAALKDKADTEAAKAISDRYKPLVVLPGTTLGMSRPRLGGHIPEEIAKINENIDAEGAAREAAERANPKPKERSGIILGDQRRGRR